MHNPPNARQRSETVCRFLLAIFFLGYTPGAHAAWEAGHYFHWAGLVVERYPPSSLGWYGGYAWAATGRAPGSWVILFSFSCLMDAWLRL